MNDSIGDATVLPNSDLGWRRPNRQPSLPEVFRSVAVPTRAGFWRKMLAFAGPGYLVAVGYMDPGNWATSLAGGSGFGYALLSVVVLSSLMAVFLQALALRLGIATGRDLAQASRDHFSRPTVWFLWITCELAIAACDLAEVIGAAIALQLLFGLPLLAGVCLTALDVMVLLWLQHKGFRWIEAIVILLITVIGLCFAVELALSRPDAAAVLGGLVPTPEILRNSQMLYVAIGILGATVMPHNLYLHSAIAQTRRFSSDSAGKREAMRYGLIDSTVALTAALFINAAILILAASAFHRAGTGPIAELGDAYRLLSPLLGAGIASTLFAVALLASGQNSTLTGTLAGQIVMEGFLNIRLPPALRRIVTRAVAIVPAVAVIAISGEGATGKLLILSQVVLSMQLSFAVFPLVMFTGDRAKMGEFVNPPWARIVGWTLAVIIAALNGWLLYQTVAEALGS